MGRMTARWSYRKRISRSSATPATATSGQLSCRSPQTCKLNGIDPQAHLADVLERIVSGRAKTPDLPDLILCNWASGNADG
jgi:hypothetical protein